MSAVAQRKSPYSPQEVAAASQRIKCYMRPTARDVISIGEDLAILKASLKHGEFQPWLEREFGMSERAATKFMRVAKVYGAHPEAVERFPVTALYELSAPSTPEFVRETIEGKAKRGEDISLQEIRDLKEQAKRGIKS